VNARLALNPGSIDHVVRVRTIMSCVATRQETMTSRIRWGRVVIAAVMSDVGVIALLLAVITVYALVIPLTDAQYNALGEEVGYYVAPTAGAIFSALSVLWVARRLTSAFVLHGVLVGVVGAALTVGFIFDARPDHRVMYIISFALKIAGGYAGGVFAQWRFNARTGPAPAHQIVRGAR
jgi:hypothetical protein